MSEAYLNELDVLSREDLISRAGALGVTRPELLTRVELRDEIVRITETDEAKRQRARGWFGVARDLVASVVEQRLNLPDAADLIRGVNVLSPRHVPPVATVTLAEIYAAQGHVKRALKMLDEVLLHEPDHQAAHELRDRLTAEAEPETELERTAVASEPPEEVEEIEDSAETEPEAEVELVAAEPVAEAVAVVAAEPTAEVVAVVAAEPVAEAVAVVAAEPVAEAVAVVAAEPAAEAVAVVAAEPAAEVIELVAAEPEPDAVAPRAHSQASAATEPVAGTEDQLTMLIYRRSGTSATCHWSIAEQLWETWARRGNGQWVVRVVQVTPSIRPVEPVQNDVPLPGTSGDAVLNDIMPGQQVRMALGWETGGHFTPAAVGVEIAGARAEEASLAWLPLPGPNDPTPDLLLGCARRSWRYLDAGSEP